MKIVHYHDLNEAIPSGVHWMRDRVTDPERFEWRSFTNVVPRMLLKWPRSYAMGNAVGAFKSVVCCSPETLLVTHGPRPAAFAGLIRKVLDPRPHHLAFAFNFTSLPQGKVRSLMASGFSKIDRFVVFSHLEREMYARYFDIDEHKIDMLHWAVRSPLETWTDLVQPGAPDYIAAIGSQGRDYRVLADVMRRLPHVRLKLVAWPSNVEGIDLPDNMELHAHIPLEESLRILANAKFMVLPLRDENTPCGHVTLVHAMHLGKAVVATASKGIADYVRHNDNGLLVPAGSSSALSDAIVRLYDMPEEARRLGAAGLGFALAFCSERVTAQYFDKYISALSATLARSPQYTP